MFRIGVRDIICFVVRVFGNAVDTLAHYYYQVSVYSDVCVCIFVIYELLHAYTRHTYTRTPTHTHIHTTTHTHIHTTYPDSALVQRRVVRMGWLRLVGSIKLYVSFSKEPYQRDDILQKRPIIFRSLLIVATP